MRPAGSGSPSGIEASASTSPEGRQIGSTDSGDAVARGAPIGDAERHPTNPGVRNVQTGHLIPSVVGDDECLLSDVLGRRVRDDPDRRDDPPEVRCIEVGELLHRTTGLHTCILPDPQVQSGHSRVHTSAPAITSASAARAPDVLSDR